MKTLEQLFDYWGNKTLGNYRTVLTNQFFALEYWGNRIAYVDLATRHFVTVNWHGSQSTERAVRYTSKELKARGYNEIVWGHLKEYKRKGTFFVTQDGVEYPLSSYYPVDKHKQNPQAVVFGTLIYQEGRYVVNHVGFKVDHLMPVIQNWYKGQIHYL